MQDGSGQWLLDEFPALFMIVAERTFGGMYHWADGSTAAISDLEWVQTNIRRGPLGSVYPSRGWEHDKPGVKEGDSPTFLHLLSGTYGLNDPERPWMGGWGGRFVNTDNATNHWTDAQEGPYSISRFQEAFQNDFAARLEATIKPPGDVNRKPVAIINGDSSGQIHSIQAQPRETVELDSTQTYDPDGDSFTRTWWHFHEASTYSDNVPLVTENGICQVDIPKDAAGTSIHVVLEVTDTGEPALSDYCRIVISVDK